MKLELGEDFGIKFYLGRGMKFSGLEMDKDELCGVPFLRLRLLLRELCKPLTFRRLLGLQ